MAIIYIYTVLSFFYIYINMDSELNKRLGKIGVENVVFLVFIGLILLGYYANDQEVKYFLYNDNLAKKKYYYVMIVIFLVVVIVGGYYFFGSLKEFLLAKDNVYSECSEYAYLELFASGAALISGIIYLYIAVTDKEIYAEISL